MNSQEAPPGVDRVFGSCSEHGEYELPLGSIDHGEVERRCPGCMAQSSRDYLRIDTARREILDALIDYAELLRAWNAPDDEHTRYQLRRLIDDVIEETMQDLVPKLVACHEGPCCPACMRVAARLSEERESDPMYAGSTRCCCHAQMGS